MAFSSKAVVVHSLPIHVLEDYLHTLPQHQTIPIFGECGKNAPGVESLAVVRWSFYFIHNYYEILGD